jgi:thymidylate synthase (FAD)
MKLPIFLARQFVRHRTACINEVSGRYATLPEEWYIPEVVGGKAKSNKQGQEDNLPEYVQNIFKKDLDSLCSSSYKFYLEALNAGVAPEHARLCLHVNHYTHWVWKQDLSNLMHFLALRLDNHAQIEARLYAQAMYDLLKLYLPKSMEYFDKYRRLNG